MANGNEMDVSGFTTVLPCSGLAKSCELAMALIHASEMERLGPGPVTPSWMVPMAADVVALELPEVVAVGVAVVVALVPAVAVEPDSLPPARRPLRRMTEPLPREV